MFEQNMQPKITEDAQIVSNILCEVLYKLNDLIIKNTKMCNSIDIESMYKLRAAETCWRIFYVNCLWLVNSFYDTNIPFWQLAMTKRLLMECIADLDYMLKSATQDELKKFSSHIDAIELNDEERNEAINRLLCDMKKIDHSNRYKSLECSTMGRIEKYFKENGIWSYNLLCTFNHVNYEGAALALLASLQFNDVRKSIIYDIQDLINGITNILAEEKIFEGVRLVFNGYAAEIKAAMEEYKQRELPRNR